MEERDAAEAAPRHPMTLIHPVDRPIAKSARLTSCGDLEGPGGDHGRPMSIEGQGPQGHSGLIGRRGDAVVKNAREGCPLPEAEITRDPDVL